MNSGPELHRLLTETRWVRGLAGALAADPDLADDLAQDACVVALDRPPGHGGNLRAWLTTVMHNLLRQHARASARRRRRELDADAERPRAGAATDELVDRATVQRAVVDAVLQLSPPFRDVVLLRYFDDLPPRAIAPRLGVPVATVHSRLQRAHAQLRLTLDRACGERDRWRRACVPLALPLVAPPFAPFAVLLAMNTKLAVAAVAVVVASAALWIRSGSGAGAATGVPRSTPSVADAAPSGAATEMRPRDDGVERTAVVPAAASPVDPPPAAAALRQCTGRIVDAEGRPVPAVHVRIGEERAAADQTGAFAARIGAGDLAVRVDEPRWSTVLEGIVPASAEPPPVLVVAAPSLQLAGHVRTNRGEALAGATVRVVLPSDLRARLHDVSDAAAEARVEGRTDAEGAFALAAAAVRGAELLTVAVGCVPDRRPLPDGDVADLAIVLERLDGIAGNVRGQVLDPAGRAVAGASVGLGAAVTTSDALGNFALADDGSAAEIGACAAGHRRGALARGSGFGPFVVLVLGAMPLTISGRVVDEHGAGLAGITVWVNDLTLLCASEEPVVVEGVACGFGSMSDLRDRFERGEFRGQRPEQVLRANPTSEWPFVVTSADGAFTLGGLEDRAYRLRALDNDTLLMTQQEGIQAGSRDARLVLDQSQLFAEVAGVVVSHDGSAVPGATVRVQVDTQSQAGHTMHGRAVASATTDAQGRFRLPRVPKAHAYFRIDGDSILPNEVGRGSAGGILDLARGRPDDLRLEVSVRMHVQVELLDANRADAIRVLDGNGEPVRINVFVGRGRRESEQIELAAGKSPVFVVPDTATTLILRKGDQQVARCPLQLRSGEVNTIRL